MTDIPRYQANNGPRKARQLEAQRAKFRAAIDQLRDELERTDAEFAKAFERQDAQATTQSRIDQLAARTTQRRLHT